MNNINAHAFQASLYRWLVIDMVMLIIIIVMSVSGSLMVAIYEEVCHIRIRVRYVRQNNIIIVLWQNRYPTLPNLILWKAALLLHPTVVLSFHVYFWRRVRNIYKRIDPSKQVLRGVWSSKM